MKKFLILGLVFGVLIGCRDTIYIYSPTKKDCITLIREGDELYIIAGKNSLDIDTNFIKIDLKKMDLADGLNVCWYDSGKYVWEVVKVNSEIIKNKLDSNLYKFNTILPLDSGGFPTESKFRKEGCATILLNSKQCSPASDLVIEW